MSQSFVIVYLKRHQSTIISCPDCRYQLLLSSLLICSPLWDWSGWEEGSENFQLSRKKSSPCVFQVVSCPFHVGCWSDHLALRLAYRPTHASGNLCHGWKILCHLCHEHWISVLSRGDLNKDNQRIFVLPGATDHPEGPGYGSGLNDVHGQQSRIAPHRLLGELLLLGQLNCRR